MRPEKRKYLARCGKEAMGYSWRVVPNGPERRVAYDPANST